MKKLLTFFLVACCLQTLSAAPINIPLGANAYLTKNVDGAKITDQGVENWQDKNAGISS